MIISVFIGLFIFFIVVCLFIGGMGTPAYKPAPDRAKEVEPFGFRY